MQLVINISEDDYKLIRDTDSAPFAVAKRLCSAVSQGANIDGMRNELTSTKVVFRYGKGYNSESQMYIRGITEAVKIVDAYIGGTK